MFVIEDERHADQIGTFSGEEDAMSELRRLAGVPWNQAPNAAPCTNSANCGRTYELVEYDTTQTPWRELSRTRALDVSAAGVEWQ
jgi:hypothetical protein